MRISEKREGRYSCSVQAYPPQVGMGSSCLTDYVSVGNGQNIYHGIDEFRILKQLNFFGHHLLMIVFHTQD